jgi:hypothetical protein
MRTIALLSLALTSSLAAQEAHPAGHAHDSKALGTIVFPNSGNAAAQVPFLKGVALLHSFEYNEAAQAFRDAQKADSGFAVAYWGEALTYSHVVWRVEDLPASRAALAKLGATTAERLAKARNARERSFGAAVEAFYVEAPLPQRVRAYADSLRAHARQFAGEQEAAAFAAHALMVAGFLAPAGERDGLFREAIALAQSVVTANPNHPGGTHYLIHLYDSPGMAAQGLDFARAYDKIAPAAEHALHMPSHIYLQLGMWQDVVSSNERAWAASRSGGDPDWHAFSWLQYGYLQQGRWAAARGLIDSAKAIIRGASAGGYVDASFAITRLEFQYAASTGRWDEALTLPPAPSGRAMSDRERGFRQFANYWAAIDAAYRKDPSLATIAAPYLALADSARAGTLRSNVMAANALVVAALVANANGDRATYLESLTAAAKLESQLGAFVGPPERVFASELLGSHLIAEKRFADAVKLYENVLRACPERTESLAGLARAKRGARDVAGAESALAKLAVNLVRADADVFAALGMAR